jgi:hypothetical protein
VALGSEARGSSPLEIVEMASWTVAAENYRRSGHCGLSRTARWVALALWAGSAAALGCGGSAGGGVEEDVDEDSTPDDVFVELDSDAPEVTETPIATFVSVVDLGNGDECQGAGCVEALYALPGKVGSELAPQSPEDVDAALAALPGAPSPTALGLDADALREAVTDGLGIRFLTEPKVVPEVVVRTTGVASREGYVERTLQFEHPLIGTVHALLLIPEDWVEPVAGIVGLHGHRDTKELFVTRYLGGDLARAGFAVLLPDLRVHDCSIDENELSRFLLESGLCLMGVRVYEALLLGYYLANHPLVEGENVGFIGHSGGSSTGNLVARLTHPYAARVIDYGVQYRNFCGPEGVHCETIPAIFPLSADINDFETLDAPTLKVGYGFGEKQLPEILEFFDEHLRQ